MEQVDLTEVDATAVTTTNNDHGWQKVTYAKRQRKPKPNAYLEGSTTFRMNGTVVNDDNHVFRSIDKQWEDSRSRRNVEAQRAAAASAEAAAKSKLRSNDDEDEDEDSDVEASKANGKPEEEKPKKPKKTKKPKVSVGDAAAKIDHAHLVAFLAELSELYPTQQDIQMMRIADYYGKAFSSVSAAQFPWVKMFREGSVPKLADIPLSHISDAVYKASVDWINQRSIEALSSFVLWSLDSILADLTAQQESAKGTKKGVQQPTSKSQVAVFVVLAMVLRRKPDALVTVLPTLRENSKYQGQDKLPVIVWMVTQASQGDLCVALYAWAQSLLPLVGGKSCSPQSRDLILQSVERIFAFPKARTILVNGAVRKGERLIPPSSLEMIIQLTFPPSSARVKATERFEAIYPTLKEVALAGSHGSKAMKQVSQQILNFALKAMGESSPELSKEAAGIVLWCLSENADCYSHWDNIYHDNLEASVSVLKKLSQEWKEHSVKLIPNDSLRETIKNFRHKNAKAMAGGVDASKLAAYTDADKYCKQISSKLSGHSCMKALAVVVVAFGVGAAFILPNIETLDVEKLSVALGA